ncbi:hypothetical protein [Soonwooa sp.]|uniref:hypothetical protein n=1 Tax=Soonwooa sp. TaxID=1938592 RepID=UPI0028ACEDED|nr:hypothetical protein [Soonwooa sp.]
MNFLAFSIISYAISLVTPVFQIFRQILRDQKLLVISMQVWVGWHFRQCQIL